MEYLRLIVGATNAYILHKDGSAVIIDPGADGDRLIRVIEENNFNVEGIVLTHAHGDHIGALDQVRDHFGAKVYMHKNEVVIYENDDYNFAPYMGAKSPSKPADILFSEEEILNFNLGQLKVMHTPGHTPGSTCFIVEDIIITGDTLFQGSIGRTDLPLGDWGKMESSLAKFFTLDEDLLVLSGHGEATTLGVEKLTNPFLKQLL